MRFQTTIDVEAVFFNGENSKEVLDLVKKEASWVPSSSSVDADGMAIFGVNAVGVHLLIPPQRWVYRNPREWPEFLVETDEDFKARFVPLVAGSWSTVSVES